MHKIKKITILLVLIIFESKMAFSQNYQQRIDDAVIMVNEDLKPSIEVIKQITVATNCGLIEEGSAIAAILEIKNHMIVDIVFPSRIGPQQGVDVEKMASEAIFQGKKIASNDFCKNTKPVWRARIVDTVRQLLQSTSMRRY